MPWCVCFWINISWISGSGIAVVPGSRCELQRSVRKTGFNFPSDTPPWMSLDLRMHFVQLPASPKKHRIWCCPHTQISFVDKLTSELDYVDKLPVGCAELAIILLADSPVSACQIKKNVSLGRNWSTSEETISGILFGYGSIPIDTFLVGWTSINPSYFDVNYRGTIGFDPSPFLGFYLKAVIPVELRRYSLHWSARGQLQIRHGRCLDDRQDDAWMAWRFSTVSGDLTWATRKPSWNCGFGWRLRSSFRDYIYIISSFCWSCHIFFVVEGFFLVDSTSTNFDSVFVVQVSHLCAPMWGAFGPSRKYKEPPASPPPTMPQVNGGRLAGL